MQLVSLPLAFFLIFFPYKLVIATNNTQPFQQRVNFHINATLNDTENTLEVNLQMEYVNNSSDTLKEIYMHLWANAYQNNQTAMARQFIESGKYDFHFARDDQRGGYNSIKFRQNNKLLSFGNYRNVDIVILYLETPILPSDTAVFSIDYVLQFPDASFSRLGHHNQTYFATQWYPKPAVYNQNGWHPMPYLHRGEFFSEFGDFEVVLTLPQNYIVASTGELTDTHEKLFLRELAMQTGIAGPDEIDNNHYLPPSSPALKTLTFRQNRVHDFAWFASKQFRVLINNTTLSNGKQITLYSFFTQDADMWFKANDYLKESLHFMSDLLGPYPWNQVTAVQGIHSAGANMEYPAITIIGSRNTDKDLERVIVHEVIHNWFYGILASNERAEPWIDEGFTTYYERRFMEKKYPNEFLLGPLASTIGGRFFGLANLKQAQEPWLWYMLKAAEHLDQAPGLHTKKLSEFNYYAMTYFKAAMAIQLLEEYLGTSEFDRIMKEFYEKWKFRHPTGVDIRKTFDQNIQTNIDWFFDDLIGSDRKTDIRIGRVKPVENGFQITLHNNGQTMVPFTLSGIIEDKADTVVWIKGFEGSRDVFFPDNAYTRISIDNEKIVPEIRRSNNHYRTSGLLRRTGTPELQFLASIKDPLQPKIYYLPLLGYNVHDGFMPGFAFYNYFFPASRNDIFFMPMYSTGRDKLSGQAWLYRYFYTHWQSIQSIKLGGRFKSFGLNRGIMPRGYQQTEGKVKLIFSEPLSNNRTETFLKYTAYWVERELLRFNQNGAYIWPQKYQINQLEFFHSNQSAFNPYNFHFEVIQGKGFLRAGASTEIFFPLNASRKGFRARIFAGGFPISPDDPMTPDFRFSLQGQSPARVSLYTHPFIGLDERPGSIWGNQMIGNHGNFKYPTPLGLTWDWLIALNLAYDLPKVPLRVFFDTGTYYNAGVSPVNSNRFPYLAGIQLSILQDFITVNFPVIVSEDLREVASLNNLEPQQRITFSIRFDKIDPMRARRQFHLLLN